MSDKCETCLNWQDLRAQLQRAQERERAIAGAVIAELAELVRMDIREFRNVEYLRREGVMDMVVRTRRALSAHTGEGATPKGKINHLFVPGDPAHGWELQCSVKVRVREDGQWVGACCGAPPEAHLPTSDPNHTETCVAWTKGEGCDCYLSRATTAEAGAWKGQGVCPIHDLHLSRETQNCTCAPAPKETKDE